MSEAKMKTTPTRMRVKDFIAAVTNETRRADAQTLAALMGEITGEAPVMWGPSIIGFGEYRYTYETGRSGRMCAVGFSPRKANLVLYLAQDFPERAALLKRLGKHKAGVGCVYVNKLADIDMGVLAAMIECTMAWRRKGDAR